MNRLQRLLRVRPDEATFVGWMVAFFAVVQASHGLAANTADALFFQRYGVDRLPSMILISGPVVMIFILGHGAGLARMESSRWLRALMVVCASWAALEWAGALLGPPPAYPAIWVSSQVIIMLTYTAMWNAAGATCTTRQAKRLFPIFATAGIAGGVIGNLLTGPLASLLGTTALLMVQSALLLSGFFLLVPLARAFERETDPAPTATMLSQLATTASAVSRSRLLRLAAVVAAAMSCLFYLMYLPFSQQVASSFATEAGTATFLGTFASIATTATFLVSLFVTNRLFARFGIVASLLLVPLLYVGGFTSWILVFTLASAAIVRGLQWVTINAVGGTAFTAIFNVLPGRRRGEVVAFMTAVPTQIGTSVAGLALILASDAPRRVVFALGLAVAAVAGLAVVRARSAYLETLVATVRAGIPGVFDVAHQGVISPTDADTATVLEGHLHDPRPEVRSLAIRWLSELGVGSAAVEPMLEDKSPGVRAAAFDTMCVIDPDRISSHAANALHDQVPEIRLNALGFLKANPQSDGSPAREALSDPDPRVRAAAAVVVGGQDGQDVVDALVREPEPGTIATVLEQTASPDVDLWIEVDHFLDDDSAVVRAAAVNWLASRTEETDRLVPALDDRSPRVRKAAAEGLAATDAGRSILQHVLDSGSVAASDAALSALTPLETPSDQFLAWARSEATRAARLASQARALDTSPRSEAQDYLVRVLLMRSARLVDWVLKAMTTRTTARAMPVIARGIGSHDAETRSQALEALETIGARSVTTVLLPLLEEDPQGEPDAETTLQEIGEDFDPWLRLLARRVISESGDETMADLEEMAMQDATSNLDPMERLLMLQRVHMFSDLDPEDLDLIARTATERLHEPGESIYVRGAAGEEMLLIVRGEAVVSVGTGKERRVVQTYGPGEPVGELALLSGEPRSADVHAGEEGLTGLVISNDNLLSVLEERPNVAMGMLSTLARRLIDQT